MNDVRFNLMVGYNISIEEKVDKDTVILEVIKTDYDGVKYVASTYINKDDYKNEMFYEISLKNTANILVDGIARRATTKVEECQHTFVNVVNKNNIVRTRCIYCRGNFDRLSLQTQQVSIRLPLC